jgi:hypothetical protein
MNASRGAAELRAPTPESETSFTFASRVLLVKEKVKVVSSILRGTEQAL